MPRTNGKPRVRVSPARTWWPRLTVLAALGMALTTLNLATPAASLSSAAGAANRTPFESLFLPGPSRPAIRRSADLRSPAAPGAAAAIQPQRSHADRTDRSATTDVAWGDMDGDGDPDLAAGNSTGLTVYLNLGGRLETTASWASGNADPADAVAWGDVDGDGDLDLAVGSFYGTKRLYTNRDGCLETEPSWCHSAETHLTWPPGRSMAPTCCT